MYRALFILLAVAICTMLVVPLAGVEAAVIYVDDSATGNDDGTSWTDAYPDLQLALAAASPSNDSIWVAAGFYVPTTDTNRAKSFVLAGGVAMFGGFEGDEETIGERPSLGSVPPPPASILSGELSDTEPTNNSFHVVRAEEEAQYQMDRFTIRDGNYTGGSGDDKKGAGVFVEAGALEMIDCRVIDNISHTGAGIYITGGAEVDLIRTTVENNKAHLGGGGAYNLGLLYALNSSFLSNYATFDGGGLYNLDTADLRNVLVHGNEAADGAGGGVYNAAEESPLTLLNCAVCDNTSEDAGAGLASSVGHYFYSVKNSIFWDNADAVSGDLITDQISPEPTNQVTWSDVAHIAPGNDNINVNPDFDASAPGPCRIDTTSDCRDAGDNTGVDWAYDIDGGTRIKHVDVDMGINEIQTGACCFDDTCTDETESECGPYVCNVNVLHDDMHGYGDCGTYAENEGCAAACEEEECPAGCFFGDADGNHVVNPADRGFISANIGETDFDLICLYDMDGNGFINAGDRGFVSANVNECTDLPDYQNGSGANDSVFPDPRFPYFFGSDSSCDEESCGGEENIIGGGGSESGGPAFDLDAASAGWYSIIVDAGETCLDGAAVFGVSDKEETVIDDAGGALDVLDLAELLGSAGASPSPLFGAGFARRDMVLFDSLASTEESGGELCQVLPASGVTLRLEVYVWRVNEDETIDAWSAALTEE